MEDEFIAHMYGWQCCTCATAATLVRIGVTSLGELLATWFCQKCKKRVMARIPLEEIIAQVPVQKLLEASKEPTEQDLALLKEAHIIWGE